MMQDQPAAGDQGLPSVIKELGRLDLISYIRWEIDEVRRRSRGAGWTPWALLLAMAGVLWAISEHLAEATSWPKVFQNGVLTYLAVDLVQRARVALVARRSRFGVGYVREFGDLISNQRASILVEMLIGAALWTGIASFGWGSGTWVDYLLIGWIFLGACLGVVTFMQVISRMPVPLEVAEKPRVFKLLAPLRAIVLLVCIGGYLPIALSGGLADARLGVLFGIALHLLLAVSLESGEPPLVAELVELHRELALESITVEQARERLETVLKGLKLEDYAQADARAMLQSVSSLQEAVADFRPIVAEVSSRAMALSAGAGVDAVAWRGFIQEWERRGAIAESRLTEVARRQKSHIQRVQLAASVAKQFRISFEEPAVVKQIEDDVDSVMAELEQLVDEYTRALEALKYSIGEGENSPR